MNKLPRAFLSHSSIDKPIVNEVASILGRAAVIYDAFEFRAGDEFCEAIVKGLERSDFFVLFASRNALSSEWVNFELSLAVEAKAKQALSKVVTYIVDPELKINDLPDWMKATLIVHQDNPGLIASDIRRLINHRISERMPSYFFGRRNEIEQFFELISRFVDPDHRPPILVYGLSGIGRRTVIQSIARDSLSFPTITPIVLRSGDLLPETYIRISEKLYPGRISDIRGTLDDISSNTQDEVVNKLIDLLGSICNARSLPVFVDEGAISNTNGVIRPEFQKLYDAISGNRYVDAMFVSTRKYYGIAGATLPSIRIPELEQSAVQNFLRIAGRDAGLSIQNEDLVAISTYTRGYPPAVLFAIDEARTRGIPQVVANQRALVNFSAEMFLRQLKLQNSLTENMAIILQLLSNYSPMPLSVIAAYCELNVEQTSSELDHLLDLAFVIPSGVNYRITEPLRDAAYRAFDGLRVDSGKVARLLDEYLAETPDDDARLDLGHAVFRASLLSGEKNEYKFSVGFAADLIEVATQSYHDQDYDLAIKYGNAALDSRPDSVDVRRYVAQALIRKERYSEAENHIQCLIDLGEVKEAEYVRGFEARRRHEYYEAIESYEKSLAFGRRGVAIHRELASCYFEVGNIREAENHIMIAERLSPHNRYIIDLRCTIALRLGDLDTAERTLNILERVDSSGYYDHRRSTLEQAKGEYEEALRFAVSASNKISNPPFEVIANLVNAQIEAEDAKSARNTLNVMQQRFNGMHHDAQVGLRCKFEIRFGSLDAAEGLWKTIRDPQTPIHRGLRLAILKKKNTLFGLNEGEEYEQSQLMEKLSLLELERNERMFGSVLSLAD